MTASDRRPKLVIGPGLIGALCLVFALAVTGRLPQDPRPALPDSSGLPAAAEPIAPEPTWLRRHGSEVGLTATQESQLEVLIVDWEAATAAARRQLDAESAALARRLETANGEAPERVLAADGETYLALSAQLSEARQAAWQAALELLDESQRATVIQLREAAPQELR